MNELKETDHGKLANASSLDRKEEITQERDATFFGDDKNHKF